MQELTRFVEFCNKTVTRLLSRDYSTSVMRFVRLLSRDYSTSIKRLQYSCQEIHKTPVKRLQHSCQEIPDKKMIEYLNFFLLCILLTLLCYLYVQMKRYITLLKKWQNQVSIT